MRKISLVILKSGGAEEIEVDPKDLLAVRFTFGDQWDDHVDINLRTQEVDGIYVMGGKPLIILPQASNSCEIGVDWKRAKKGE